MNRPGANLVPFAPEYRVSSNVAENGDNRVAEERSSVKQGASVPAAATAAVAQWQRTLWSMVGIQFVMTAAFSMLSPIMPLFLPVLGVGSASAVALWAGILAGTTSFVAAFASLLWGTFGRPARPQIDAAASTTSAARDALSMRLPWRVSVNPGRY